MNRTLAACLVLLAVAACGRRDDLYLPGTARDIVTRPVQTPEPGGATEAPNSPQTVDSPETPATPAPEVTAPRATGDTTNDKTDADKKKK
jgi:predicted small lipoprotein YifL